MTTGTLQFDALAGTAAVRDYLRRECFGAERAQTIPRIARELGMSVRDVQAAVTALRQPPEPVGSNCGRGPKGIYWIATEQEWRRFSNSYGHRTLGMLRTWRKMRKYVPVDLAGQRHVFSEIGG